MANTINLVRSYLDTYLSFQKEYKPLMVEKVLTKDTDSKRINFSNLSHKKILKSLEHINKTEEVLELQFLNCELQSVNLENFKKLVKLVFYGIDMNTVEVILPSKSTIKFLTIEHCMIDKLPTFCFNLEELVYLRVPHNKLIEITISKENQRLIEYIDIRNNKFKVFPQCISSMENLQGLLVDKKLLSTEVVEDLKERLPNLIIDNRFF